MSTILKGNILNVGQLENEIFNALNFYGCGFDYKGPTDQCEAQRQFANRLANAISNGVSRGVQQYLLSNVTAVPGIPVTTAGGPSAQVGATIAPGILQAP